MEHYPFISGDYIQQNTSFPDLVAALKKDFGHSEMIVPLRHHHDFPVPGNGDDSSMLLMPAWNPGKTAGVKIVVVSPDNREKGLPTIQGTYLYFDTKTGSLKAILEAKTLTNKRTAAASALASQFLSREESSKLLMIGTGSLAPDLIRAHSSIRPIQTIWVYGRSVTKAEKMADDLKYEGFDIQPIHTLETFIKEADIISCATTSASPLFSGNLLRPGQHLDLVGSYRPHMREVDDTAIIKSNIYLDNYAGGLKETGDIVIPIKNGILSKGKIKADLFELCSGQKQGRQSYEEITLFKSVGHALEDLTAANYYYDKYLSSTT